AVHRGAEVVHARRVRLDEEELAVRARGRRHVEVERDLAGPAVVSRRQRARVAVLVHLLEAAVRGGARRQAVLRAVDREVGLGLRVVERVDYRDRLAGAAGGRDLVGADEVGRAEAARRREVLDLAVGRDADARVAGQLAALRRRAHRLVRELLDLADEEIDTIARGVRRVVARRGVLGAGAS